MSVWPDLSGCSLFVHKSIIQLFLFLEKIASSKSHQFFNKIKKNNLFSCLTLSTRKVDISYSLRRYQSQLLEELSAAYKSHA
mmetsp:Transcript_61130/g.72574  ORF Transcript_61130/g.72574 Transcript_61130/m.72574 type:complete len:82 (+) Transcript_61130:1093-1338(+)